MNYFLSALPNSPRTAVAGAKKVMKPKRPFSNILAFYMVRSQLACNCCVLGLATGINCPGPIKEPNWRNKPSKKDQRTCEQRIWKRFWNLPGLQSPSTRIRVVEFANKSLPIIKCPPLYRQGSPIWNDSTVELSPSFHQNNNYCYPWPDDRVQNEISILLNFNEKRYYYVQILVNV